MLQWISLREGGAWQVRTKCFRDEVETDMQINPPNLFHTHTHTRMHAHTQFIRTNQGSQLTEIKQIFCANEDKQIS